MTLNILQAARVDRKRPLLPLERLSKSCRVHQTKTEGIPLRRRAVNKFLVMKRSTSYNRPIQGLNLRDMAASQVWSNSERLLNLRPESHSQAPRVEAESCWDYSIGTKYHRSECVPLCRFLVMCWSASNLLFTPLIHGLPAAKKSRASALNAFKLSGDCSFCLSGCNAVWKTLGVIEE